MKIEVLGSGCAKCEQAKWEIEKLVEELGLQDTVEVVKNESLMAVMSYGVTATPAFVVDGNLVHSGSAPFRGQVEEWIKGNTKPLQGGACTPGGGCC